jgi:hypothetical protein
MSVRRLSMPTSKTRYIRLALMMLVWLIALELLLRLPPIQARLNHYAHPLMWYTPYVEQRISVIRKNKDADIWFAGSSVVVWGVNPASIDPLLNQSTGSDHKSINLGLYGMYYIDYLEDYLTNVFLPEGHPKVIVVGIFPYAVAYSPQLLYDSPEEFQHPEDNPSVFSRQLSWWLYEHTALYRFVDTFRFVVSETPAEGAGSNPDGFVPVETVMESRRIFTPGTNTNDHLEESIVALDHLNSSLTQRGIRLLLLNLPVYDPIIEQYPGGPDNYQAYIKRVTQFTDSKNIPFLDLQQWLLSSYKNPLPEIYFKDNYHLNEQGANIVAPVIADFLAHNLDSVAR